MISPSNPNGCFDWWGYTVNTLPIQTSLKYATQAGPQMVVISDELSQLAGTPFGSKKAEEIWKNWSIQLISFVIYLHIVDMHLVW